MMKRIFNISISVDYFAYTDAELDEKAMLYISLD